MSLRCRWNHADGTTSKSPPCAASARGGHRFGLNVAIGLCDDQEAAAAALCTDAGLRRLSATPRAVEQAYACSVPRWIANQTVFNGPLAGLPRSRHSRPPRWTWAISIWPKSMMQQPWVKSAKSKTSALRRARRTRWPHYRAWRANESQPVRRLECKRHPIGATGLAQVFELGTQLCGEAGLRQVAGARVAVAESGGWQWGIEEAVCVVSVLFR